MGYVSAFRGGMTPAEQIDACEWARRYRVLGRDESSIPGPYDPDRTPFAAEIMRCLSDKEHRKVVFVAGAQVCKSEIGRNWIGSVADLDPGPVLIVFPTEDSATETIDERIVPMIENTPRLSALKTGRAWDVSARQVRLRSCRIYVAWATSAQTIAARPIRYLNQEEVDKWGTSPAPGKEGDPGTLSELRTTTYEQSAKIYSSSTPTNASGPIWQSWEAAGDRRRYWVPCPRCGKFQILEWDRIQFLGKGTTSPGEFRAIAAEAERGLRDVHYQCAHCDGRIESRERRAMVAAGRWQSEGHPPGEHPVSSTVAFQISALYSPFVSWAQLVREHFEARLKGAVELHGWINGRLGWIVENEQTKITADLILRKATRGHKPVAPRGTVAIISTADTQKNGWPWETRAHLRGGQSRLLGLGHATTLAELRSQALLDRWPLESGRAAQPELLLVDAGGGWDTPDGGMTDRIYKFAASDSRIRPIKGHGGTTRAASRLREAQSGKECPEGVALWVLCTQTYKDVLAARVASEDPELWQETSLVTPEYAKQMAAEHKVAVRKGQKTEFVWQLVSRGSDNHYWDCGVYQVAAADMLDLDTRADAYLTEVETDADGGWWSGSRNPGGGW